MFYVLMFEFMLLGVIGGLLGIFYRNCLKVEDMIFYPLYSKVFVPMVKSGNGFLHFIAYPLGFCIYCSTFLDNHTHSCTLLDKLGFTS